jgi:carbon-monoxide dehydrogenase small subunit
MPLDLEGAEITTIEGLAGGAGPHPLQVAFAQLGAAQCGYCTPAMLLTAKALLDHDPEPSREAIKQALSGVLCRCTGYAKIFEAIELAASRREEPVV